MHGAVRRRRGEGGERQRGDVGAGGRGSAAEGHGGRGDVRIPRWRGVDRSQSRGRARTRAGAVDVFDRRGRDEPRGGGERRRGGRGRGRGYLGQRNHRRGARSRENDDGNVRCDARSRARGFGGDIGAHARGDAGAHAFARRDARPGEVLTPRVDSSRPDRRVVIKYHISSISAREPRNHHRDASRRSPPPRPEPEPSRASPRPHTAPFRPDARIQRALPRRRLRLVRRVVEQQSRSTQARARGGRRHGTEFVGLRAGGRAVARRRRGARAQVRGAVGVRTGA